MAAPAEGKLRKEELRRALAVPIPVYVEDSEVGPGLCCACGKKGVLGRCLRCGLLMHYSCIAPILPGRPQPCPRCLPTSEEDTEKSAHEMHPHQLEVGAQFKRLRVGLGGVDAAAVK